MRWYIVESCPRSLKYFFSRADDNRFARIARPPPDRRMLEAAAGGCRGRASGTQGAPHGYAPGWTLMDDSVLMNPKSVQTVTVSVFQLGKKTREDHILLGVWVNRMARSSARITIQRGEDHPRRLKDPRTLSPPRGGAHGGRGWRRGSGGRGRRRPRAGRRRRASPAEACWRLRTPPAGPPPLRVTEDRGGARTGGPRTMDRGHVLGMCAST